MLSAETEQIRFTAEEYRFDEQLNAPRLFLFPLGWVLALNSFVGLHYILFFVHFPFPVFDRCGSRPQLQLIRVNLTPHVIMNP